MTTRAHRIWRTVGSAALVAVLCVSCASPSTTSGWRDVSGPAIEFAVPGKSYRLQMPPLHMRTEIERLMRAGRAPRYTILSPAQMRHRCRGAEIILGCTKRLRNLRAIYISSGLKAEERHMVLVHEYAHYLYRWEH